MRRGMRLSETTPNGLCFALPWTDTADIEQRGLVYGGGAAVARTAAKMRKNDVQISTLVWLRLRAKRCVLPTVCNRQANDRTPILTAHSEKPRPAARCGKMAVGK